MTNINNIFSGAVKLSERVAVYVPGTAGPATNDEKLAERMTEETAARLSELFGGATISSAAGAWVSEAFGLIREQVNIVYAFGAPEDVNKNAAAIMEIVQRVKSEMAQEAVSVEIGGALYLV